MANFDPLAGEVLLDSSGAVAASAKIYYYETGSTTPKAVYSDAGLTSAVTQPVRSSSIGIVPVTYLIAGRYKRAVTTSADVTISAYAADPIDASVEMITASAAPSPTFAFLRYYNTSDGHVYERKHDDSGWTDLGPVDALLNAATVTQQLAGTSAAVSSTPDSVAGLWQRGTSITPSAGAVSLPSTGGGVFTINAGAISSISAAQGGRVVIFEFAGASAITHNASSMDLPGNANITTAAGDRAAFVNLAAADASGSNWRCLWLVRDDGSLAYTVATQAQMEAFSNATFPVVPSVVQYHPGVAKVWADIDCTGTMGLDASHNVTSVTDLGVGNPRLNLTTAFSSANYAVTGNADDGADQDYVCILAHTTTIITLISYNDAGVATDCDVVSCIAAGDQ